MSRVFRAGVVGAALALVLAGCGNAPPATAPKASPSATSTTAAVAQKPHAHKPARRIPLRKGEVRQVLRVPRPYTPSPPSGVGTDDYHCFLLDPKLTHDTAITGYDIRPGNLDVVHHVILFRVPPGKVRQAEAKDAETPGDGWTCFGNSGIDNNPGLDDAPWLGAWAPGGGERLYGKGLGTPLAKGSRIVVQIHYNLLAGDQPDQSSVVLRETGPGVHVRALRTMLLPAPVELPCRKGHDASPLCNRAAAVADGEKRFGAAGYTADLLHLICGKKIVPGNVQHCDRTISRNVTVRAVAGHMHLLGTSIKIAANPGTPRARTLLDIPVWNFDNQGSKPVKPLQLHPWDKVRVTCHHAQFLRDRQPSFEKQRQDRYIVWGEGSTDEMCLGILLVTDD
jgi:predicted small lipoprotein YifL